MWPSGANLTIQGAVEKYPGSVQYGYSDGMTFPPFNAIDRAKSLHMFVPQFIMPLQLTPLGDVEIRGIALRR